MTVAENQAHLGDTGYQMISSIDIRNFRCFKQVSDLPLKRFTFLVGGSGTGKTAFLEALFLAGGGNAEIYFRVRRWRGFGEVVETTQTRAGYESVFRDLFYNFDHHSGAYIRVEDSEHGKRTLEISYEGSATIDLPLRSSVAQSGDAFTVTPITFKWDTTRKVVRSQVEVSPGGFKMSGGFQEVYPITFISPQTMNSRFTALQYSELSKRNAAGPVLDALKAAFPEVTEISLEAAASDIMLHVSINGLSEKLPLGVLSGGMNKYLSILLAILSSRGGVVMVDEIENGFYYANVPSLLKTLIQVCRDTNVQLIASTHSYEFLQALAGITDEWLEKHLTLLRMERISDSVQPSIRSIAGRNYKAAIESGFEVR